MHSFVFFLPFLEAAFRLVARSSPFSLCIYIIIIMYLLQEDNAVQYQDLPKIDQHALFQLENVINNIRESYESYQFFKIFQVTFFLWSYYLIN